jgi:hypothetical protein
MRDFNTPRAIPLFAALMWWDGFRFWDFFPILEKSQMNYPIQDVLSRLDSAATEDGRKFQVLLIGESEDIIEAIHTLHSLKYAEVGAWSPLLPVPNSTKLMSILTRYRAG